MGARAGGSAPADLLKFRLDPLRLSVCLLIVLVVSRVHQYVPILAKTRPLLVLTVPGGGITPISNPRLLIAGQLFEHVAGPVIAGLGIMAVLSVPFGISMGNSGKFVLDVYLEERRAGLPDHRQLYARRVTSMRMPGPTSSAR